MLRILQLDELQAARLRLPRLADAYQRRDAGFAEGVKAWLADLERVLESNRLPAAARLAALRTVLIDAERGVQPAGVTVRGRPTPRKVRDAAAADVLRRADAELAEAIRADAERIAEAERVVRQVAALGRRKGLLPATGGTVATLAGAWAALAADPDMGSAAAHVAGLVGASDALILLDRALV